MAELVGRARLAGDERLLAGVVGELVALADDDDREVLARLVPLLQQAAGVLDGDRLLGDQDHVGAAGDPGVQRDPAGVPAHHLDDHDAVVRLGRRVQAVDRLGRDRDGGVEPERVVGAVEVVVDRLRHADDGEAVLRWSRAATPSVSSPPIATSASSPSRSKVASTFSTPPSTLYGFVRVVPRIVPPRGRIPETSRRAERLDDPVDQAAPSFAHARDVPAAVERPPRHRADDRVQPRAVAAAREDAEPRHWRQSKEARHRARLGRADLGVLFR